MINVTGCVTVQVPFDVDLHITEEALSQLTPAEHDLLITQQMNFQEAVARGDVKELEVYDVIARDEVLTE